MSRRTEDLIRCRHHQSEEVTVFSEQTNELIHSALSARENTLSARQSARERTQARNEAAASEAEALEALKKATSEADDARQAALTAITEELSVPADEAPADTRRPQPMQRPQRAAVAGVR